jgi:IMP dehydrogenase
VPVDKLVTPQSYVDASGVKSKLKEMKRGIKEAIQVLVHNGQYVILDGNHRATAAWVRGDKTIPADLYKYENGEFGVYEP